LKPNLCRCAGIDHPCCQSFRKPPQLKIDMANSRGVDIDEGTIAGGAQCVGTCGGMQDSISAKRLPWCIRATYGDSMRWDLRDGRLFVPFKSALFCEHQITGCVLKRLSNTCIGHSVSRPLCILSNVRDIPPLNRMLVLCMKSIMIALGQRGRRHGRRGRKHWRATWPLRSLRRGHFFDAHGQAQDFEAASDIFPVRSL
jgi:hypothetical protein